MDLYGNESKFTMVVPSNVKTALLTESLPAKVNETNEASLEITCVVVETQEAKRPISEKRNRNLKNLNFIKLIFEQTKLKTFYIICTALGKIYCFLSLKTRILYI